MVLGLALIMYVKYTADADNRRIIEKPLRNHVAFTGQVLAFNISGNHSFGIIKIKVVKSNKSKVIVLYKNKNILFPYRIEGGYAEFYGYISLDIKINQTVKLNSDEKLMVFYDRDLKLAKTNVFVTSEKQNIAFIKENTSFK